MKKSDCLGIDKNGAWQVLQSKYDINADDFEVGDELWILDDVNKQILGIRFCSYTTTPEHYEWYEFKAN